MLVFTAEEAWLARFGGEEESIHLHDFPAVPAEWRDEALAEKVGARAGAARAWSRRELEKAARAGTIGSSLQAASTCRARRTTRRFLSGRIGQRFCIVSAFECWTMTRSNRAERAEGLMQS